MDYTIDSNVANKVGINAACVFNEIYKAIYDSGENEYTVSLTGLTRMMTFLSKKKIETSLKKLHESGLIDIFKKNKKSFDQTNTYKPTEEGAKLFWGDDK